RQALIDLDRFDKVIVTSQHATGPAFEIIDAYWPQLPVRQPWFAIGRKTGQALRQLGVTELIDPGADLSSEQLLDQPQLAQPLGQKILLLKGAGGRDEITQTLSQRGATVVALSLYRRVLPDHPDAVLAQVLRDQRYDAILAL